MFTIILTVFNKEKEVKKTLQSLIDQTCKKFKLIIINDGSTDNSLEVINNFSHEYKYPLKVYSTKNSGVAKARNFGIEKCDTEYLFFLDGDDCLENNCVELFNDALNRTNLKVDIYVGNFKINSNNNIYNYDAIPSKFLKDIQNSIDKTHIVFAFASKIRLFSSVCNKLYRKEFIQKNNISFQTKVLAEDRRFNYDCFETNLSVKYLNSITYICNRIENSRSKSFSKNKIYEIVSFYIDKETKFLKKVNLIYDINKYFNQILLAKDYTSFKEFKQYYYILKQDQELLEEVKQSVKDSKIKEYFKPYEYCNKMLKRARILLSIYNILGSVFFYKKVRSNH